MALKQFVIPWDSSSIQTGDIDFKQLADNAEPVTFQLTNVEGGSSDELDLVTHKNGSPISHKFDVVVADGVASVELSASEMADIFADSDDKDWDYVRADWTVDKVDIPEKSNQFEVQLAQPYDTHGFPPKPKH